MRVRLEYFDQNESLERQLPLDATVAQTLRDTSGRTWWLIRLDRPLTHSTREPGDASLVTDLVAVGGRHAGEDLQTSDPAHVHIVLVPTDRLPPDGEPYVPDRKLHVAWGIITRVRAGLDASVVSHLKRG